MHILIAPNAFKNSLDAIKVAEAIDRGLHHSDLSCTTTCFPIGDGGDGTGDLLIEHIKAKMIHLVVHDPLERKIESSFGWDESSKTAIIELASASGIRLLKPTELDPLRATTYGTGELIAEALNKMATRIILCVGGSATVDGGTGILNALGVKFFDAIGNELDQLPSLLSSVASIDITTLDQRISNTEIIILSDVENLLLGPNGAAAVFGPQKGASDVVVRLLDTRLSNFRHVTYNCLGKDMGTVKHGGAAGGVAAGLHVFLNAKLVNGIDYFLEITRFERELKKADLVITGEGRIDEQTLHGKGPYGVAKRAKDFSIPVVGIAGQLPERIDESLMRYFDHLISINDQLTDLKAALKNTSTNLEKSARKLGDQICASVVQNLSKK